MSDDLATQKVETDNRGCSGRLPIISELHTTTFRLTSALSENVTFVRVCFMGVKASVCDCDTGPTHRSVYKERAGKTKIPLTYKKKKPHCRRSDQLIKENLLSHDSYGLARVESVQPLVPVVHTGTHGRPHDKHAPFKDKKQRSIHVNSLYSI